MNLEIPISPFCSMTQTKLLIRFTAMVDPIAWEPHPQSAFKALVEVLNLIVRTRRQEVLLRLIVPRKMVRGTWAIIVWTPHRSPCPPQKLPQFLTRYVRFASTSLLLHEDIGTGLFTYLFYSVNKNKRMIIRDTCVNNNQKSRVFVTISVVSVYLHFSCLVFLIQSKGEM